MKSICLNYKKEFIVVLLLIIFLSIYSISTFLFDIKSYVVTSGSMEPSIPAGSIIYVPQKSFYNNSDVISFNQGGKVITHRVASIEKIGSETFYKTKGDANSVEDSILVSQNYVVGTTILTLPSVGKVIMLLKTPFGFAAVIVLPALLYLLIQIFYIRRDYIYAS